MLFEGLCEYLCLPRKCSSLHLTLCNRVCQMSTGHLLVADSGLLVVAVMRAVMFLDILLVWSRWLVSEGSWDCCGLRHMETSLCAMLRSKNRCWIPTRSACIASLIDRVGFNVPLDTLQVISGMGFYGPNDPTDSVKALKEVVVLRIGFNPTRSTSPCYNPTHACNIRWYTKYTKMNLSAVKWAQWDKTQSRELLGLFISVCIALFTIVVHNVA